MPIFESSVCLARPVEEVFEFFSRPENLGRVSPPEMQMRVEGPELLNLGARLTLTGRRWGVTQRVVSEITVFEPGARLADEQREGPFRRWVHAHEFEAVPGGTRVTERVEFEPPGGVLGLVMTAAVVERELRDVFAYRSRQLLELFGEVE